MKNLTKQIIAFALMVCMLCAVMAPTASAEDGVLTYDLRSTAKNDAPSVGYVMNDKVTYAGTNASYMYLRTTDFFMYRSKVDNWYAVKVTGMNNSMYSFDIRVHQSHASAVAVYLMTESEFADVTNNFNAANWLGDLPANSTGSATTYTLGAKKTGASATTDNMYFVFKTTAAGNGRLLNITMTPVEAAAEQTFAFNTAGRDTNWSFVKSSKTFKTTDGKVYAANTTAGQILALQLNNVVAGTYRLDFAISNHAAGSLHNVYILPASVLEAGTDVDTIKANLNTSIGTVLFGAAADGVPVAQSIPYYTFEATGAYVLVFEAAEDGRPDIAGLTITPTEKVVNDTYYTVADAIEAGETNITLSGNITEDINLTKGEILDLNGNTVTGDVTAVYGTVVDNGAAKGGVVGKVDVMPENPAIALLDNDTYRFFAYDLINVGEKNGKMGNDGAVNFGFGLFFTDAAAYDYVADGGLSINATLTWSGSKNGSAEIGGMTEAVAQWIAAEPTSDDGRCLYIKVTGLEENLTAGDIVTVTPSFTYANGVSGSFDGAISYTVGQ